MYIYKQCAGKYMYTMGYYCTTVHMKKYSSAGALWTIPWDVSAPWYAEDWMDT